MNLFTEFYEKTYKHLNVLEKFDATNLSHSFAELKTVILTAINNNIIMRFEAYVNRYVNGVFSNDDLDTKSKKKLKAELKILKRDIFNDTQKCDEKYHNWLLENKPKIIPLRNNKTYHEDIADEPHKYIKHMIYMVKELEKKNSKLFQFFPLKKTAIPGNMVFTTTILKELFFPKLLNSKEDKTKYVWSRIFRLKHKIFKLKKKSQKYVFDYAVITDGHSASVRFIHRDQLVSEKRKGS